MFQTLAQKVVNAGLSNDEVTTYGLAIFGIMIVHKNYMHDMMVARGYPLHSFNGYKFVFFFGRRCY